MRATRGDGSCTEVASAGHPDAPGRARGRRRLGALAVAGLLGVLALPAQPGAAAAADLPTPTCVGVRCTVSYPFTGTAEQWTAPGGVVAATVTVSGAAGGTSPNAVPGGRGATVVSTVPVVPGRSYPVVVGGTTTTRAGGFNGGAPSQDTCNDEDAPAGGGGSSRFGGNVRGVFNSDSGVLVIAGGGGGAGGHGYGSRSGEGGAGGASTTDGGAGESTTLGSDSSTGGGGGLSYRNGNTGGAGGESSFPYQASRGGEGESNGRLGGSGGPGADGLRGKEGNCYGGAGGGGGGGIHGGGGGGAGGLARVMDSFRGSGGGGGGGGTNFVDPAATEVSVTDGASTGNGTVTIAYRLAPVAQTTTFTSTPPAPAALSGTYLVRATASSGLPVSFSASGACTVNDNEVLFQSAGTCTVTATQAGSEAFLPATAQQTITVPALTQTISFGSPPKDPAPGEVYGVDVVGSSTGVVVSGSGACTTDEKSVRFVRFTAAGDCVISAYAPASGNYAASPTITTTIVVTDGTPIRFTSPAPVGAVTGDAVTVTAVPGKPATGTLTGLGFRGTEATCTVDQDGSNSRAFVTLVGVGECTVTAFQYGSGGPDKQATLSFTVGQGPQLAQVVTLDGPSSSTVGTTAPLTATGGASGNPVTFTVDPTTTNGSCTLTGTTLTFTHTGTCVVNADQAGTTSYTAAPRIQRTIPVTPATQTITFTTTPPGTARVGDSYAPVATGGASGLPVVLGATGACSLTAGTVTFTDAGTCTITANQAGDLDHTAAPQVTQTVTVDRLAQVVTLDGPSSGTVGTTAPLTATGGASGNPVTFTVDPTTTNGSCTLTGTTLTFTHTGTCVVNADQAGTTSYTAAPRIQRTIPVTPATQTITFTTTPPATAVTGVAYPVAATATSGLAVTLTASGPCTFAPSGPGNGTVTLTAAGPCTVTAVQLGDPDVAASVPVTQTFATAATTGGSDLAVTVTPGPSIQATSPLTVTVTVTNRGSVDSGAATTTVLTNLAVTDPGGGATSVGPLGTTQLQFATPNVSAGRSVTYTVTTAPTRGLALLAAVTRGVAADPALLNNAAVTGYLLR